MIELENIMLSISFVCYVSGQLYQLVLTHGTIIRENENIRRQTRRIEVTQPNQENVTGT